jgi:hypothetical protein
VDEVEEAWSNVDVKEQFRDEYMGANLGDARRSDRLVELGTALAAVPGASFPGALGDGAALEAAYRFFGNGAVEADKILQPHFRESAARCAERGNVVVAHDTSDFVFPGETRRGLGRMRGQHERGFFAHMALATSWDSWREPLGVLHLETWTRDEQVKHSTKKSPRERQRDPERESQRWMRGVEQVEGRLGPGRAVHVMDREADAYDLLATLIRTGSRFILRAKADRRVAEGDCLTLALSSQDIVVQREVPLSGRKLATFPRQRRIHPPRDCRTAVLGIKATPVTLLRPRNLPSTVFPACLGVHVVAVEELDPPAGEPPVSWRLYTTEPIDTAADLERVVDGYRCRWRIEEFFKVLKTGCAIEKRQLETGHALVNALAVYIPIAWRVLRHRTLAQLDGKRPASSILTALQIKILRCTSKRKLPSTLTVQDALFAVAELGGHIRRNGPPGWLVLIRGYERLLILEQGAQLAREM